MVLYQEHPALPALAPYLDCLWTCRVMPGTGALSHRVLPDNCIDILWHDNEAGAHVAGMMSKVIHVPITRPVRTIAVRFKPGAAACFFDFPLHEMADLHPALDALWPPGLAAQCADALWAREQSDDQAMAALQSLLLKQLRPGRPGGLAATALAAIEAANGSVRIETLAASLGVTRQHLSSQFRSQVGLGAKTYARVCRFRAAAERIRNSASTERDWPRLALELGYYDQSHLIHEFRELAGHTPDAFTVA